MPSINVFNSNKSYPFTLTHSEVFILYIGKRNGMSLMEYLPTLSYFYTHTHPTHINTQIRMSEKATFFNVKNWERC